MKFVNRIIIRLKIFKTKKQKNLKIRIILLFKRFMFKMLTPNYNKTTIMIFNLKMFNY